MNEFFKKLWGQVSGLWAKWTLSQKLILGGVTLGVIIGLVVIIAVSSAPTMVPLINAPIADKDALTRMQARLDEEGIHYSVGADGRVMVDNSEIAKRAKAILVREDLIPKGTDPWAIFDVERWTLTDMERDINKQRAIRESLRQHIEALSDVDAAQVELTFPEAALFSADQKPPTASIIITPRPGSDIATNRAKIEGIQKLVKFAVVGLTDDNIAITDRNGILLNDFQNMADFDRLELAKKSFKLITSLEQQYASKIKASLQSIYGADRVRDLDVKFDIDTSATKIEKSEIIPTVVKPDNLDTPYDDSDIRSQLPLAENSSRTEWEGTGYNPMGPTGTEGQVSPSYQDMQNMNGRVVQETKQTNYEMGRQTSVIDKAPETKRLTVSVNIDGRWRKQLDEVGNPIVKQGRIERVYEPLSAEELKQAAALVQNAIGYDSARKDAVTVTNIAVDRTLEHQREDEEWLRQQQLQQTILYILIGVSVLLVGFIVFRLVSREIERRKRLREEELSRQHQIMRERALQQAEEEGVEVSMSVEERKRLEMQENAINMAKEHPEDVAQLIRTWLMEE
jgi:flagellar M-ring protein FliF